LTEPTGCSPFHAVHAPICKKIVVSFLAGCVGLIYAKQLKILLDTESLDERRMGIFDTRIPGRFYALPPTRLLKSRSNEKQQVAPKVTPTKVELAKGA
jgi:hypothetical protein